MPTAATTCTSPESSSDRTLNRSFDGGRPAIEVGALPHDLPAVIHPDDIGHFLFSVLLLGLLVVGMISGIQVFRAAPPRP
ncbi:MAG: hypothetical protein ACR2JY_02215 [Chloroflexota bacterium]